MLIGEEIVRCCFSCFFDVETDSVETVQVAARGEWAEPTEQGRSRA
jgi:hypothetical protein